MTAFALTLVLSAAFIHASWNFLAKRAGGGAAFVWLFAALSTLFYAPLAVFVYLWQKPNLGWVQIAFMAGSALIHVGYFLLLQRGYRSGDLSLVYPLARGTGPTLSTIAAILFFRESPSAVAFSGALLVAGGSFFSPAVPARSAAAGNEPSPMVCSPVFSLPATPCGTNMRSAPFSSPLSCRTIARTSGE